MTSLVTRFDDNLMHVSLANEGCYIYWSLDKQGWQGLSKIQVDVLKEASQQVLMLF